MSWLWSLIKGNRGKHVSSAEAFQGVLKYNTVFVTDENLEKLTCRGFGARRLRNVAYGAAYTQKEEVSGDEEEEEQTTEMEDLSSAKDDARNSSTVQPKSAKITVSRVDLDSDTSPMILFDEEAFYLFRIKLLELQHEDGSTVTLQDLWDKFLEKNRNFPAKYKVYLYFREQNFVVKTGVHYGLDYAVYRTLPTHCHSEMCALVVDATEKSDISEGMESSASKSQLSWRHVSTMTRVMPDVMKLLVLCYVLPANTDTPLEDLDTITNEDVLRDVFDDGTNYTGKHIDYSTPACLDHLRVHPTTCLVRRLPCKGDSYESITDIQMKYRRCSILKKPRIEQVTKKKRRKRRDYTEIRKKTASKHNKVWKKLLDFNPKKRTKTKSIGSDGNSISKSAEKRKTAKEKEERKRENKVTEQAKSKSLAAASETMMSAGGGADDIIALMNARLAAAAKNSSSSSSSPNPKPALATTPALPLNQVEEAPPKSKSKKRKVEESLGVQSDSTALRRSSRVRSAA